MKPLTVDICGYDKLEVAGGPVVWLMRFPAVLREHGINVRIRLMTWDDPQQGVVLQSLQQQGFDVKCERFTDTDSNIRWQLENLADSPPDVLVPSLVTPAYFAGRWAREAGIPTVGILHSDDPFYSAIQQEFIFGQTEYAMSAVVCVSEELARQVSEKMPPATTPVRIPYGVPTPEGAAIKVPGRLRVGFVGRLTEEQKRISEVTRAFCRITQQLEGVEAIIYGDGPDRQNVVDILAAEGNSGRVSLAGAVPSDQIQQRLIDECDTVVLLSDYEGLPISLLEAMACGLVPVCLNIRSGIPELIDDGITGLLVDDREDSFTGAIRRLRDDDELWHRQSLAARKRIRAENSLDAAAELWCQLFNDLHKAEQSKKTVAIPKTFVLPPHNPELKYEDVRIQGMAPKTPGQKLWNSFRKLVRHS